MLLAWSRGKKRAKEYEDEILSSVLGPLLYLSPQDQLSVVRNLLLAFDIEVDSADCFTQCEIDFWPNLMDQGRCEPDVVIKLRDEGAIRCVLIIEAKWNSPQSEKQLTIQWNSAKLRYDSAEVYHFYLTKNAHDVSSMLGDEFDIEHANHLKSVTWSRLCGVIATLEVPRHFHTWKTHVRTFLSGLDQGPLLGVSAAVRAVQQPLDLEISWRFSSDLIRTPELLERYGTTIDAWEHPTFYFFNQEHQRGQ